ncbi:MULTISPECIES: hypothetical protein [Corynebacterium]|uniref:Uncharacterized protein n=2 Tax=Corynebacterium hadale TaxID=2026255 RepID=A0A269PDQ1_9CORY|nr:hypothetical protein [Corynebacterium hadale]PAJ69056.1 hypothetical protein CIG21_09370 [Corynebacterium hadale]WKC61278.1 hypothetical protein CHAD_12215 [Corynebacterium hadale]
MPQIFLLSHLAEMTDLAINTVSKHYASGLTTPPDGVNSTPRGKVRPYWREDGYFALYACGATEAVPVKGFGVADGLRGYYLCPAMGGKWLGVWDNVPVIGLYRDGHVDFYPAGHPIRIEYLDPVRREYPDLIEPEVLPIADGDMILSNSGLSDADVATLRAACIQRWIDVYAAGVYQGPPPSLVNPARYAYFALDHENPMASGVPAPRIRGRRFILDDVRNVNGPIRYAPIPEVARRLANPQQFKTSTENVPARVPNGHMASRF